MMKSTRRRSDRTRLTLETMEDRMVPATISVANATLNEVGTPSALVSSGSGGLTGPKDLTLGPDGNLYVASSGTNSVIRYNATTGQLIGTFVLAGSGGLSNPFGLAFGPDGNLYVGSVGTNAIYRYSGTTGAFQSTFVPAGSGGLNSPIGTAFGPDGNLYVSSRDSDSILRYQGPSGPVPGSPLPAAGQSGATFVTTGSGALDSPFDLTFGPDGNLYVASTLNNNAVLRFDGATGGFINTFVPAGTAGLGEPRGLAFDQDGRLYVADVGSNSAHRFDSAGQYLDDPVTGYSSTPIVPIGMAFDTQGRLLVSSRDANAVVRYDSGVLVTLSAASPTLVSVDYATADGTADAADYSAQAGTVRFAPGQTSRRILLVTHDDIVVEGNESFAVQLSNPAGGATIAAGSAAVTIVDDEATRQITIADVSTIEGDHAVHDRGDFVVGYSGAHFNPVTFGPDGNVYTAVGTGPGFNSIRRYDGSTGAFLDTFVPGARINGVRDIVFRAGFMYVGSEYTDEVLRFNATTGEFVDAFVTAGSGGIDGPHGLSFGPDANGDGIPELYVSGRNSFNVVRYDGATGAPLGTYVSSGSGGLSWPESLTFDPSDAYVYVASTGSNRVLKFNAHTGAYVGVGASSGLSLPKDVEFGPDGLMYVASAGNNRVVRFTAAGSYVDEFVSSADGLMTDPHRLSFGPDGDLYVSGTATTEILRFGTESEALFTVTNTTPSTLPLTVNYATTDGSAIAGSDYTAVSGTLTFAPGVTSRTIRVPILDDAVAESTATFTVNLSDATGAIIADSQAVATITDNDATKFYVVNDGSPDQTYRYGDPGNAQSVSTLGSGNTAPRGAASNAAGTTVWVADANGKVYVYNPAGGLLGSWTAGSLPTNFQVEGITTNGADIWLLDNKLDKVFKYTGAASRLSGSQSAASSFTLNSSNSNGKGIVTDGSTFWVVNDASTDKVFKYTLTGSLLGSWTIDIANASPTGLTINPANVSDIWIVDNGTDKVYQYAAAAGRTSGSQSAVATFALAAGNTNPQDIADPPPASLATATTVVEDRAAQAPQIRSSRGSHRRDMNDIGSFSLAFFNTLNYNSALDFNDDGRVDISDFGQFSVRYFTNLP